MPTRKYYYWDSSVFLSYIENTEHRANDIEALLFEIQKSNSVVITSFLTVAEVSFAKTEKETRTLDDEIERRIKAIWADRTIFTVEPNFRIMEEARALIRTSLATGLKIMKPPDSIHIATAQWANIHLGPVVAVNTYDTHWVKYKDLINLSVYEPKVL